jgi:Protein of unknown function (DUF3987)
MRQQRQRQAATQHFDPGQGKPPYRFAGELPGALAHLRNVPRWVGWNYVFKDGKWTKPPFDPHTGRFASVNKPSTWSTYDRAVAGVSRHGFDGIGVVLTADGGVFGVDLDHCITDSGSFAEHAAKVIEFNESYMEVSPSGEGIRMFALGNVEQALKDERTGIEVYGSGRYSEGLRPLKMLAAAAREAHKEEMARYEIDLLSAKARSDNAKKSVAKVLAKDPKANIRNLLEDESGTVQEPTCRRYIATNATTAALGVILQQNPNGVLVDRDELLALLERLDDEGQSEDRGFYLVGWAGNLPYTFDRIVRGLDLHIDSVCISIIGTQPARISQYLEQIRRGARNNDGRPCRAWRQRLASRDRREP